MPCVDESDALPPSRQAKGRFEISHFRIFSWRTIYDRQVNGEASPEDQHLDMLQAMWEAAIPRVFRRTTISMHVLTKQHRFVSLDKLTPIVQELKPRPIVHEYLLPRRQMRILRLRAPKNQGPKVCIQFGEIRVEGFPHWEPVVVSFRLVPEIRNVAKDELDRCQFVMKRIETDAAGETARRFGNSIAQEFAEAARGVEDAKTLPGFIAFQQAGVPLQVSIADRIFPVR